MSEVWYASYSSRRTSFLIMSEVWYASYSSRITSFLIMSEVWYASYSSRRTSFLIMSEIWYASYSYPNVSPANSHTERPTWIQAHPGITHNASFNLKQKWYQSDKGAVDGWLSSAKRAHIWAFALLTPSGNLLSSCVRSLVCLVQLPKRQLALLALTIFWSMRELWAYLVLGPSKGAAHYAAARKSGIKSKKAACFNSCSHFLVNVGVLANLIWAPGRACLVQ